PDSTRVRSPRVRRDQHVRGHDARRAAVLSRRCAPPPPATLFPYTTLFRSDELVLNTGKAERDSQPAAIARRGERSRLPDRRVRPDRKSTRLNSSHLGTSYAVFCLKKKTVSDVMARRARRRPRRSSRS